MKRVWHIARKDVRRLALPVLAWIGLIVLPVLLLRLGSPTIDGHAASSIGGSLAVMSIWFRLLMFVQMIIGFVLAGAIVVEDSLLETNGFWMTRPISNARLLAAKVVAAAILFVGLPVVALSLLWLGSGFNFGEVWLAGVEFAKVQGVIVLVALAAASLARTLAQFLLISVVLTGAYLGTLWITVTFFHEVSLPVRLSRQSLTFVFPLVAMSVVLTQQFLTRRTARGWMAIGSALVACIAINMAWPWNLQRAKAPRERARAEENPADRSAEIVVGPTLTRFDRGPGNLPTLFVSAPWNHNGRYVPVFATLSDGSIAGSAVGAGEIDAGLRTLGFRNDETPLRWQVMLRQAQEGDDVDARLSGVLEVWAVRPSVVCEIPLQLNGSGGEGANRTRIVALGRNEGRLDEVFLEERDAATTARAGANRFWSLENVNRLRYLDRYFLVQRGAGKAQHASAFDVGSVEVQGLVLRYVRLNVSGEDEWRDSVLIKLRFERERAFERAFEVRGISSARP